MEQLVPFVINVGVPILIALLMELRVAHIRSSIHQKKIFSNVEEVLADVSKIKGIEEKMTHVHNQTDDLWDWHNISGEDGVKLWYVRKSLEVAIRDLTEVLHGVDKKDSEMVSTLSKINSKMDDLKNALAKCEAKLYNINE
jgi:hypothetical protein